MYSISFKLVDDKNLETVQPPEDDGFSHLSSVFRVHGPSSFSSSFSLSRGSGGIKRSG